jgi:hypothetical protein
MATGLRTWTHESGFYSRQGQELFLVPQHTEKIWGRMSLIAKSTRTFFYVNVTVHRNKFHCNKAN